MNRKEEMEAFADEIEASDGIYLMGGSAPFPYQVGIKKTAQVIAALRASASPKCICDTDHPLFKQRGHHPHCPASSAAPEEGMKPHFYVPDYQAMGDCRVCGHNDPNMLMPQHQAALPSDSGKAAPVASDKELGKKVGEYLGMSGIDAEDVAHLRKLIALAPATEGGRRGERYDELRRCSERYLAAVASLGEESPYNKLTYFEAPILSMPSEKLRADAHDRWIELNNAGVILRAALSPSPSVGTPAQTSAERESG